VRIVLPRAFLFSFLVTCIFVFFSCHVHFCFLFLSRAFLFSFLVTFIFVLFSCHVHLSSLFEMPPRGRDLSCDVRLSSLFEALPRGRDLSCDVRLSSLFETLPRGRDLSCDVHLCSFTLHMKISRSMCNCAHDRTINMQHYTPLRCICRSDEVHGGDASQNLTMNMQTLTLNCTFTYK
jgi:hypothetical protein